MFLTKKNGDCSSLNTLNYNSDQSDICHYKSGLEAKNLPGCFCLSHFTLEGN